MGPRRDPNAMDVDRGRGRDRTCYMCGKWGHQEECGVPRGKCTAKRRRIIWGKRGTNNVENKRRVQRRRRRKYIQ